MSAALYLYFRKLFVPLLPGIGFYLLKVKTRLFFVQILPSISNAYERYSYLNLYLFSGLCIKCKKCTDIISRHLFSITCV